MKKFFPKEMALHEKLQQLAIETEKNYITVGDGIHRLTAEGSDYGIPLMALSLINAIPVPSFGLKSLLGLLVSFLGLQMFIGKRSVWLPKWFTHLHLHPKATHQSAKLGKRLLPKLERFVRPRYNWMKYDLLSSLLGIVIFLIGSVMTLPVPGSKIFTSPVLLALSLGLIAKDGLLILLASLSTLVIVIFYMEVFYLLYIWFMN